MNSVESINPFKVPRSEIDQRIANLQTAMQKTGMDAVFIVQHQDLYYFSGTAQNAVLYIPAEAAPTLFVRKYMPRAEVESAIARKIEINSVRNLPGLISDIYGGTAKQIGFELDVMPVNEFRFYRKILGPEKCADASLLILNTRMVKSRWEIAQMKKTTRLSAAVFNYIRTVIQPGISEIEFSGIYEAYARKHGHAAGLRVRDYRSEIYNWHVLSGESGGMVGLLDAPASGMGTSPAFPCGASGKLLAAGEPIMIDLGIVINGYHSDETRMFAIGDMPKPAEDACRAVVDIHNSVLEAVKPGVSVDELFEVSVSRAHQLGYADQYLGPPGYKVKFIGHGVGVELVEPPFVAKGRKDVLTPGMTIALEPKMVFEKQFSAGIESMFVVTETGAEMLSEVPTDIFIC
ncbi:MULTISPECIES: M24 family metallopeptidase [Desulfococcus]|uniref:Peptidase M24 n=1 Tax=Desulfococcus multivorans DSM 2059 TaxID=1121405 RepID=S7VKC7_DESML|nr:Xaa-Pro peptidase family protein [Desulfococcus multivorans]AOY59264.1 Xaa-pro aminopeptidase [Desulfococcus multivorans]AQV01486.1 peptidase M24 [Desulfococcus multivorans]EPR45028.1 peptidase M24 [Desulfococcus multivorans DSM 2059]SKA26773.1 Xaa-Pro aminopeptidase [Desulfococcus multivorans DSM 2059]